MKIFNTSFHRCATTSIATLLGNLTDTPGLGCDHGTYPINQLPDAIEALKVKNYCGLLSMVPKYNRFSDSPWFLYYHIFDYMVEGAMFLHCPRDAEEWFDSCERYLGAWQKLQGPSPIENFIYGEKYGAPNKTNKNRWIDVYLSHQQNIEDYFQGRDNFLSLGLFQGEQNLEQKICNFLKIKYNGSKLEKHNNS